MKIKNVKLEWYAFYYDWNKKSLVQCNILGDWFKDEIIKRLKSKREYYKTDTYAEFKNQVRSLLMYRYWSRCEYEVLVRDLSEYKEGCDEFKIDVWYQLELNLDRICEYIIRELNLKYES